MKFFFGFLQLTGVAIIGVCRSHHLLVRPEWTEAQSFSHMGLYYLIALILILGPATIQKKETATSNAPSTGPKDL